MSYIFDVLVFFLDECFRWLLCFQFLWTVVLFWHLLFWYHIEYHTWLCRYYPCMCDYACARESHVKASYLLPEEYMKEIALQESIGWQQLMVFVKYLSFILKENCLACSTYIWGSYDQMPKMWLTFKYLKGFTSTASCLMDWSGSEHLECLPKGRGTVPVSFPFPGAVEMKSPCSRSWLPLRWCKFSCTWVWDKVTQPNFL